MLDGEVREADIGLLFDPRHEVEARLCGAWRSRLGIQLEVNQKHAQGAEGAWRGLRRLLAETFERACAVLN